MTFHCANGISQGVQLSPLLYNVYTDDLSHYLQATGVGSYVGSSWVNSLSYAANMVLLVWLRVRPYLNKFVLYDLLRG